jgi:succinoglycan biosynthesis protein ExoA
VTEAIVPGGDVLVVMPCLNEAGSLPRLLRDVLAEDADQHLLVVVADGGSTDGTRELAQQASKQDPRIVLLDNPLQLQSAGVNLAARHFGAGRRWLVRIDAHASYPPGYAAGLVRTALRVGATAVTVSMVAEGEGCFQRAAAAAQNSRLGTGGAAHRRRSVGRWVDHGHHALVDLASFLAIGGYEETFTANEDAEFDLRLTKAGGRIWLSEDLAILYHPRRTPTALFAQYFRHGAGRARTLLRHRSRPRLRQLAPAGVAPALVLLVPAVVYPALAVPAALWALACLTYGAWLGVRAQDGCAAAAGVAAMTMHLAWSLGFWSRLARSAVGRRGPANAAATAPQ